MILNLKIKLDSSILCLGHHLAPAHGPLKHMICIQNMFIHRYICQKVRKWMELQAYLEDSIA